VTDSRVKGAIFALVALFSLGAGAATSPLEAYRSALAQLAPPGAVVFEYAETRTGPTRTILEQHRVYRSADGRERNETIAADGAAVVPAIVRFSTQATWPYDVRQFAVDDADYTTQPLGTAVLDGKRVLAYSTVRVTTGDFAITALYLDPLRHLPVRESFDAQGGGCKGSGTIAFGPVAGHWMPTAVSTTCTVTATGAAFRESIRFSGFSFPQQIPADIFGAPQ